MFMSGFSRFKTIAFTISSVEKITSNVHMACTPFHSGVSSNVSSSRMVYLTCEGPFPSSHVYGLLSHIHFMVPMISIIPCKVSISLPLEQRLQKKNNFFCYTTRPNTLDSHISYSVNSY
jgi:hypothetical protein